MKLGRLLTQSDLITEKQLEEALNAQLIHGGHLGTCLIEREFITEEQLGQVLSESFGIACASKSVFDSVSRFVVGLIPKEMVEKHQAVPFHMSDDLLDVAMIDPKDLRAIDELAFSSGRNIRAWIAPEIRILQAMDRYYGITRRMRYVTLSRQLDQAALNAVVDRAGEIIHSPSSCEAQDVFSVLSESPNSSGETSSRQLSAVSTIEAPLIMVSPSLAVSASTRRASAPGAAIDELSELSGLMVRVAGASKLGELAVKFARESSERVMLFEVDGVSANPWHWGGFELSPEPAQELKFPITSEPMFGLLKGECQYRGPIPEDGRCDGFFNALKITPPRELLLVPSYANDRLVAMLYADDGGAGKIVDDLSVYRRLMTKVGLAMDLIRIKSQIRSS